MEQPSQEPAPRRTADDASERLVDRVAELAGLDHDAARESLRIVIGVFEGRLSGGEVRRFEGELPAVLRNARGAVPREDEELAEPFDRSELFGRAAARLPGGGLATGRVVASVLAAVRERLSEREAVRIGNELPPDLRTFWEQPLPDTLPLPQLANLRHNKSRRFTLTELAEGKPNRSRANVHEFLGRLAARARLSEPDAETAAVAALWFIGQRIPSAQAETLFEELPRELQVQLQDAVLHGDTVPDWQLRTYYALVADQLLATPNDVVPLVHFVFDTVRESVSPETLQMVGSLLPASMKDLWLGTPFAP